MVKITEELIRKKSEHNEGIIGTLEELSLHQEDVEKIEHIHNWCKNLQILYLQSNLISKIENLNKLKNLRYLNLAINNIEKVENLQGCEALEKLDLTLNFIGELESVCSLEANVQLKQLYLTGNPCTDYKGYRQYVIAKLKQIQTLDSEEVTRSERIKALQVINQTEILIQNSEKDYKKFREQQRVRLARPNSNQDDEEFWKSSSEHAPETRLEIARRTKRNKNSIEEKPKKKDVRLFSNDGRPLNINQAKVDFSFNDEDPERFILDVATYKYLDTNLIDVDLQPIVVRIRIKDKIFQFVLPEEIHVEKSVAQRSQTTGHLVITMPKVNYKKPLEIKTKKPKPARKYLEVEQDMMDFSRIVEYNNSKKASKDNLDVPPLEYG